MNNKKIKTAFKLTWGEIAYHIGNLISDILGREIRCKCWADDALYWNAVSANTEFTKSELNALLAYVNASEHIRKDSIPTDSETGKSVGAELSMELLKIIFGTSWQHISIVTDGLWFIGLEKEPILPKIPANIMLIDNAVVDMSRLWTKAEILEGLSYGEHSYTDLIGLSEKYVKEFGNELVWHYPLSDDKHNGAYFVLVQEGLLYLPYLEICSCENEIFEMSAVKLVHPVHLYHYINNLKKFTEYTTEIFESMYAYFERREACDDEQ